MGKQISWDETGSRWFENGCDRGVLYVQGDTGNYPKGAAPPTRATISSGSGS